MIREKSSLWTRNTSRSRKASSSCQRELEASTIEIEKLCRSEKKKIEFTSQ
jgi:hypothetical protein